MIVKETVEIEADAFYRVRDISSFENKVLPYIYGGGIYYKTIIPKVDGGRTYYRVPIKTKTLSQLVTALTGMLRYSPSCRLETLDIRRAPKRRRLVLTPRRSLLGIILKPSLSYESNLVRRLVEKSLDHDIDFIKDDDASGYGILEAQQIQNLLKNRIAYFQKIVHPSSLVSDSAMVVPWVDGWYLLDQMSQICPTISHCANLPPYVSWPAYITLSRLSGADFVIIPDSKFDKTLNIKQALEAATGKLENLPPVRLIISGGVNPQRIKEILDSVKETYYENIDFAVGSWLFSGDLDKNFKLLKRTIEND